MLASQFEIDFGLIVATLGGTALIIGSACVINNYIDRKIDVAMERTKKRALVTKQISVINALLFAGVLGILGFVTLLLGTNLLTFLIGLAGYSSYLVLYGIAKRRSVHGTLVGSISGAMPPVAGYTAVTNQIDSAAIILFLILVFWQMAHFYAIAIYRLKDYKAADIPVLPAVRGIKTTKHHMLYYIAAFILTSSLLTVFGYTGYTYLLAVMIVGLRWFKLGLDGLSTKQDIKWARRMFGFSLVVTLTMLVALSVGGRLP